MGPTARGKKPGHAHARVKGGASKRKEKNIAGWPIWKEKTSSSRPEGGLSTTGHNIRKSICNARQGKKKDQTQTSSDA